MKSVFFTIILCLSIGCRHQSTIPISNTLEMALDNSDRYNEYVDCLNRAYEGDTTALEVFFKIDWIYDVACYYHSFNLLDIMQQRDDACIAALLLKLNKQELANVKSYLEVAIDQSDTESVIKKLKKEYPKSLQVLGHLLGNRLDKKGNSFYTEGSKMLIANILDPILETFLYLS